MLLESFGMERYSVDGAEQSSSQRYTEIVLCRRVVRGGVRPADGGFKSDDSSDSYTDVEEPCQALCFVHGNIGELREFGMRNAGSEREGGLLLSSPWPRASTTRTRSFSTKKQ